MIDTLRINPHWICFAAALRFSAFELQARQDAAALARLAAIKTALVRVDELKIDPHVRPEIEIPKIWSSLPPYEAQEAGE